MRLLHVSTFELEDFVDEECPTYVILSHTWGKEEITYQDILLEETVQQLKSAKSCLLEQVINSDQQYKQGCLKIAGCALRAHEEGAEYIWCDTCCIDKTNSTELSEAINSMYMWYKDRLCYVYLADVPAEVLSSPVQREHVFSLSRWFTRGWTLQELIAPADVLFFDATWHVLGTRQHYGDLIAKVTGIDLDILLGDDPLVCNVAARMSWASHRQTTRVEDLAYCLMGLFGVNMPLIYGEKHKAFFRLQTEIMKVSEDHSLFAWKTPEEVQGNTTHGLLANSPADFAKSRKIMPINPFFHAEHNATTPPFSMTSRGVNISLPLLQIKTRQFAEAKVVFAILNCRDLTDTRGPLGLFLVRSEGVFRRCLSHLLHPTIDVAGIEGRSKEEAIYVAQQALVKKSTANWGVIIHVPELSSEILCEGAILKVIPKLENQSISWNSEKRLLNVSSGMGAALYIGRDDGRGKIFLIGVDSELQIRCVLQRKTKRSNYHDAEIDGVLDPSRFWIRNFEWINCWYSHGDDYADLHTRLHTSLDLGQWATHQKHDPRFYQRKYDKIWNPCNLQVYMAIDRTSLEGQGIYEVQFHKRWN
ncbi:MAG: hypothetical protein Q9176_004001 [Flavoplaca citrina]